MIVKSLTMVVDNKTSEIESSLVYGRFKAVCKERERIASPDRENFSDDVSMLFGLDKCAVLVLKRGKIVRTKRIELPDGKPMREVNLEGYKYLGVLQLDSIMNREMKEKVKSEYIRRVKNLLK